MRIDDLDPPRVVPRRADDILRTLEALRHGMGRSGRVPERARRRLSRARCTSCGSRGKLYACACSRREIADSGVAGIEGYVYPGTCREGFRAGRAARAWRVDTRRRGDRFRRRDAGAHRSRTSSSDIGDFVLYRADRVYAYQLAVAVDDAEQGITHVVRGADLLDSTPRQIYLQRLLGLPTPRYAHLPVAVNAARREALEADARQRDRCVATSRRRSLDALRVPRVTTRRATSSRRRASPEIWEWARRELAPANACRAYANAARGRRAYRRTRLP